MAGYKGHIVWALFTYASILGVGYLASWHIVFSVQNILFICLGSMFPDIDTKSKGQKIFYYVLAFCCIYSGIKHWYCTLLGLISFGFLPLVCSHRGIFHNIFFILFLISITLLFLIQLFPRCEHIFIMNGLFFACGALSHLIVDFGFRRALRI